MRRTTESAEPDAGSGGRSVVIAVLAVVAVLAAVNLADHAVSGVSLWLGPPVAVALVAAARLWGLSWQDLGLGADRAGTGARWAAAILLVVAVVYLVGVLVPLTREAFLDSRYHVGVGKALLDAFVVIPLGTVLPEEIAFRSVLWGLLRERLPTAAVMITTSILFGLWHVLPSLHLAGANEGVGALVSGAGGAGQALAVVGAVLFTALGGLVFAALRRRTGSLLPSIAAHWATNAFGVLFGVLAWHLA